MNEKTIDQLISEAAADSEKLKELLTKQAKAEKIAVTITGGILVVGSLILGGGIGVAVNAIVGKK